MSFAEIFRAFKGAQQKYEGQAILTRQVAYQIYAANSRNPKPIDHWWQIGEIKSDYEPTQEELDEIWQKYGKL